jgi:hypothetical protein
MGYWLEIRGLILGRGMIFLCSTASKPALGSIPPLINWIPGILSPGVKRSGHEAEHSPPSSGEVKSGGAITPLSHTYSWRGV